METCSICGIASPKIFSGGYCHNCFYEGMKRVVVAHEKRKTDTEVRLEVLKHRAPGGKSIKFQCDTTTRIVFKKPPPPRTLWDRLSGPDII